MAYLSLLKEMYDADNNMLPGIQVLNYNQNANDASYRNLAQLIGVENGIEKVEKNTYIKLDHGVLEFFKQ